MNILVKLPILLNKDLKVDYQEIKELLNIINDNYIYLFAKDMDGKLFSLKEKEEIFTNIKSFTNKKLIYEANEYMLKEEQDVIKRIKPDIIVIHVYKDKKIKPKAFEKYVTKILKDLKLPVLLNIEDDYNKCLISYYNIANLIRTNSNFLGVILNTKDVSFINKIKQLNNIKLYIEFNDYIDCDIKKKIDGVVSNSYLIANKEVEQYFFEYDKGFTNPILKEYLKFIDEVISYYPLCPALKYLLSKKGFNSIYSKLPYHVLKGDEKEKLDYIF